MVDILSADVQANIFTDGNQQNIHMAALAGDGYVAVWDSQDQNGSGTGLVAQIYNDLGERVGLPFFIEETTSGNQTLGDVAATADGGFVVTWETSTSIDILARQFDASGAAVTGEFTVNTETYSSQDAPAVTGLSGGGYVISWASYNNETSTWDIRAQSYDASGVAAGGEFTINTTTAGTQYAPEIAALSDGGFVVTWEDRSGNDGGSYGIYGQRFDASGAAQGAEFLVNTTTISSQYEQGVVGLSGGGYVVVWRDDNSAADGSQSAVVAQVYDVSGAAVGGEFVVNEATSSHQYEPSVTATPDGGFFVSWTAYGTLNGTTYDIVGRHFDATGTPLSGDVIVNDDMGGTDPRRSDVIALSNGGIVVGWDYPPANGDGDGRAVYTSYLQLDGSNITLPTRPVLEAFDREVTFTETDLQAAPQILDGSGAVAVSGPTDFEGGRLTVTRITALGDELQFNEAAGLDDDILGLRDQGIGAGQIGVSGATVTFGGVVIGTITSDGANRAPLEITFNSSADRQAVEAVAENLTYQNLSDDPIEAVELAILLEDGDGAASEPVRVSVTVMPEADAPQPVFDGDIEVNTFFNSTQQQPEVTALSDGGWVVMWESYSQDSFNANTYGIVGQRYDASGAPVGAEFLVNTISAGSEQQVDLTAIEGGPNAGGFIAVWYGSGSSAEGYIRAQIFDAASQPVGGEFAVPQTVYSTQREPAVAAFADGSFAVSWSSYEQNTNSWDIVVQRFDASGTPVGAEIVANSFTPSTQDQPDIVALSGGGFAVSWRSYDQGGTDSYEIATRVYDAGGAPLSAETRVNSGENGTQTTPHSAALDGGGYVVVWDDQSGLDGHSYGVYGQMFSAAGTAVGTQFLVNEITQGTQSEPVVTALPGGGFAVAYYTTASVYGGSLNIAIQHYDGSGNRIDGETLVNQDTTSSQYQPAIATLQNGDAVVVWRDDSGRDGSGAGIVMQIVGDPANYAGAQNNPIISIAQGTVVLDETDVNNAPQLLFAGVDVGDADSADFDGGTLSVFRAGAAQSATRFDAPDDETQDNLGIRDQGAGAGQIGVSGASVTFGGAVIGTITSDGADGSALTLSLNANSTPEAIEALLQNVTYANPSDDPQASREIRVVLTDGDGGSSTPVNIQVQITEDAEGVVALSPERQVNSFEESTQGSPDVAGLASGGYVSVWQSYDQDAWANNQGIYAQRFDASGQAIGSEIAINTETAGSQQDPQVTGLLAGDGGGYVVVWQDASNNSGYIKAQVHNDDGSVRTAELMVETFDYSSTDMPAVTAVPGGFLVTWSAYSNTGSNWDIRGQYFDGTGVPQGSEFIVNTAVTAGVQRNPDVAVDASGNAVVVWEDQSARDGSSYGVYGQRIDSSGALVGGDFQINTNTTGGQYLAQVAYLTDGRFVVAWYDDSALDGSGGTVAAQLFAADGTTLGAEFIVNEMVSNTQTLRDVIGLSDGGFAIAFDDNSGTDGSGVGVFLQQYNADGSRRDGPVQINEEVSSTQNFVRIAEITDGTDTGIAAVWESSSSGSAGDGSSSGIFTRVFGEPGTLQAANLAPDVENLGRFVDFDVATIGTAQIIDNSLELSDPDSADFNGGTVELRFLDHRASADDQLSVVSGKGITVSGADILYDGVIIGAVDATDDGVNGADLVINLNANANTENLRYLLEQLGYASSNPVGNTERNVSIRVSDGDSNTISEGDSIRIDIENSVSAVGITLNDVDDTSATETQAESGIRLDPAVDFDYGLADGFDGGFVDLGYRSGPSQRFSSEFETLSVANDGAGTNQIGVSGTNITFQGTIIGSVDGTLNGQNGADLRINLVAAATPEAVDALIEAFVYQNNSDGPADLVRFDVRVTDALGSSTGDRDFDLTITPEVDGATVPLGGEMQVNAFTEGAQSAPAITQLDDGGFVVTWQSYNQDSATGFNNGVYQQRYTAEGEPVGPEVLVNETTSGAQDRPEVAGLTGGGWVTVWDGPGTNGTDVFARVFDASGAGGAEFQVNLQDSSTQSTPSVTALSNGGFVVTWASQTSGGAGDGNGTGVTGRLFDASGAPVGAGDFVINSFISSTQQDVEVAGLTGGGFVAVWESNEVDGNGNGVAFQRFDNAGVAQGVETIANATTTGAQDNPRIASLTDGGFVIVWQAPDLSGDGVYLQRYDASGAAVGGEILVNDYQSSTQGVPDVVGTTDGGWVVVWNDGAGVDGSGWSVNAQRYDASGNRVDGSFIVNEETSSTQDAAAVATLTDGRVVVAWNSATSGSAGDGSGTGVFIRLFGTEAQAQSGDPVVGGIADIALDEADLNAGFTQVFPDGSISVAGLDSADFDGGRLMVHVVRDFAAAELFKSPDDLSQDVMSFAGTGISISGTSVSVDGIVIGTLEEDGGSGAGLQVLLNADATPERVESLLGGLNYRNPSDDPRATREIEVTLSDGAGGVLTHQTFAITIAPEVDGFEKVGPETQANSFTTGAQDTSDVAGLAGGGHVVVWTSSNQDNPGTNDEGVFAQRFDVDGQPVGPEFQVNTTFAGGQTLPSVIGLADGSFVVGWQGSGVGDANGIFGQRFAADSSPIGTEFRINDTTSSSDTDLHLAASPSGGFMAVWYSSSGADVQARIYDAAGVAVGSEFTVNTTASGTQYEPDVAALSGGGYAVTWRDSNNQDVVMRVFDAAGSGLTSEITVNTNNGSGTQFEPAIAALAGGGFVVTWTDNTGLDGSANGTFAQIYTAAGAAQGTPFLVNETVSNSQDAATVVGTPDGGFVVVYRDTSGLDGSGQGVVAQQFDANGNRIDGQIIVNTETSSTQNDPSVDVLANGAVVVSWTSNTSASAGDGNGTGVFTQILGDPTDFNLEGRPQLQGVNSEVTYLENALNIGPQLLDANNAVAVSDSDSADFDGGFIRVDNVIVSRGYQDQIAAPDNFTQDNLGLRQAQGITISGGVVSVDGTQVGTITETGVAGDPFEISLNANATVALVELLVENLTYRNTSDDPEANRVVRVQIADGDGGVSDPTLVTINVEAEIDGAAPVFGERQANTATASEQSQSDVAYLDDGGFVIVWRSYSQDETSTYGVYGQRFDANGNAVGSEFLVNTTVAGSQYEPTVAGLDTGGWVVTWRDDSGADGSSQGVFMQRYASDGTTAGTETQVNTYVNSSQYQPDVTVLANGDYVVTWTSWNNTAVGGSGYDIFAQVYQADGTTVGAEFLVNTEVSSTQDQPSVSALANGGFAIAWESETSGTAGDGNSRGVFYQVFAESTANYAPVGGELQANSFTDAAQDTPAIAGLTGGGYVVVWESAGQDGSGEGVFAQQFDAAGVPVSQEFRVNDQRISNQSEPAVAALSTGGYVVVFTDYNGTDGSGAGVYAQQYAANGNRIDDALQVNTEFSGAQSDASVAALDNGGFVVSWTSQTSATAGDGSSSGVFYQVFSNSAPVVTDVSATVAEDTDLVFSAAIFETGFADAEGQALSEIRIDVLPSTGTLEFNGSPVAPGQIITTAELDAGALVFIPPADFNGSADFGWTGSDGSSFAATVALTNITVTPVNDPVGLAAIPNQTIGEGSNLNIQALLTDPDNDTYAITVNYGEGNPDVTFNTASKTPGLSNFYETEGVYTVDLDVDDQNGSVESISFTVTVENAAPNADSEFYNTDEDTAVSGVNIFIGDSDPGNDPFTITGIDGAAYTPGTTIILPSGASVSVSASGDLVYDPTTSTTLQALAGGQSSTDSFTYTIADNGGLTDFATVTISVSGADDNVSAEDDIFSVDEDSTLNGNVFADNGNGADIDPEGDGLTVTSVNGSATLVGAPIVLSGGGVLQIGPNGDLSFAAGGQYDELNVGDTRDLSFSYVVEESGSNLSASAQGTITVTGVNDDPTANADARSTALNTAVNIDVAANDTDVDQGDSFTVTAVGTPANGTVVLEADGTVTYTPTTGYSGPDSFSYTITDTNGGTAIGSVSVEVQGSNAPQAQDDAVTTDEATTLSGDVLADNGNGADSDPEGDDFSVTAVDGVAARVGTQYQLSSGALLTLNADGTFDYNPNGAFEALAGSASATDGFSYTITDENGGSDLANVVVTVTGLNDAPAMADGAMNAAEDGSAVNFDLEAVGDDIDSDDTPASLTYAITGAPGEGTASIVGTQLNFDPGADFQDLSVGETRDVTVSVTATDSNGATSNEGVITVSVLGVNDAPTLAAGVLAVTEDGAVQQLDLTALGADVDSEDDGATLSYTITGAPGEGSASISGGMLSFDPGSDFQDLSAGETRDVTVTVEAMDAQGATVSNDVTVTVTGVNDAPVAVNDATSTDFNTLVTVDVLSNDSDVDNGTTLVVSGLDQLPSNGTASVNPDGTISYEPDAGFGGVDTFSYIISDGAGGTATGVVSVTVTENDPPVAVDDGFATDEDSTLVGNVFADNGNGPDSDPDGEAFTVSQVNGDPAQVGTQVTLLSGALVTLNANGTFDYDPNGAYEALPAGGSDTDSFTYTIADINGLESSATVTVQISGENDAPTAQDGGTTTDEDIAVYLPVDSLIDDVDGDTLTVQFLVAPEIGSVTQDGTGYLFTPAPDTNGSVDLLYTVTDPSGAVASGTITVDVAPVNDAPVFDAPGFDFVVAENQTAAGGVSASDVDNDTLSYSILGGDDSGLFTIDSVSGALTFNTAPDFEAPGDLDADNIYQLSVSVSDGDLTTITGVSVTVTDVDETPGNRAPAPVGDILETDEDSILLGNLLANDTDPDGDLLEVVAVSDSAGNAIQIGVETTLASGGTLVVNADGSVVFNPAGDYEAQGFNPQPDPPEQELSFVYSVSDGEFTEEADFTLGIRGVNDAPVLIAAGPFDVAENSTEVGVVTATDVDSATLNYSIIGGADEALFEIDSSTGALVFRDAPDFEAPVGGDNSYEVQVQVSDGQETDDVLVSVNVTDVDETPVLNEITGTSGSDYLVGTDGADAIRSLAGSYDKMRGGAEADQFIFGAEVSNGIRERDVILDYEVGIDQIVLEDGASVLSVSHSSGGAVVFLEGDRDAIYVRGNGVTADNLTIITDDIFEFV